jgi:hypothetical protein
MTSTLVDRANSFAVTMFRAFLAGIETNRNVQGWSREASDEAEKCFVAALDDYAESLRSSQSQGGGGAQG